MEQGADRRAGCRPIQGCNFQTDGRFGTSTVLEAETWYDVKPAWTGTEDKAADFCLVYIDGTLLPMTLPLNNTSRNGICYVRFRSTAREEDLAGWLVEHITANVDWRDKE